MANPKQVAAVQSCRGSHTHSLLVDPKDKDNVYIYISGTGQVRQAEELAGCSGGDPKANPETALFRIDIIKVPLAHPELAKIVSSPRIFTDMQTGDVDGLWKGGTHGEGTQPTSTTNQCHDITIYSAVGLAAGACSGNGILLDITDPVNPKRIDAVSDPNYAYWHSATFSNDGTKVLYTDEWGGGSQPRCRPTDPMHWGADAIFNLSEPQADVGLVLQDAGAADRPRELRGSQRLAGTDPRARRLRPGVVSGRRLDGRFHRPFAPVRNRLLRPRSAGRGQARHRAASGRSTGITATSTVPRSRAEWTCSA